MKIIREWDEAYSLRGEKYFNTGLTVKQCFQSMTEDFFSVTIDLLEDNTYYVWVSNSLGSHGPFNSFEAAQCFLEIVDI